MGPFEKKSTKSNRSFFERIYNENIGLIQFAVSRFRFSAPIQDELIQEVFLRYWQRKDGLDVEASRNFLLAVARNLAIDCYRKQKRRGTERYVDIESMEHELASSDDPQRLAQLQIVDDFLVAISSDPQASTLHQYYSEDLTIREIAAKSHESTATVSSRLSRQRRKYKSRLKEKLEALPYSFA